MLIRPIMVSIDPDAPKVWPKQPLIAETDGDFSTF